MLKQKHIREKIEEEVAIKDESVIKVEKVIDLENWGVQVPLLAPFLNFLKNLQKFFLVI